MEKLNCDEYFVCLFTKTTLIKLNVCFQVGNRVGVKRCSDDTMHIFIDGEDMGPAATAVAKVHTPPLSHSHIYVSTMYTCTVQ